MPKVPKGGKAGGSMEKQDGLWRTLGRRIESPFLPKKNLRNLEVYEFFIYLQTLISGYDLTAKLL